MKLFICLHPKTSKKEENIYFKGMKCLRYKTSRNNKKILFECISKFYFNF